MGKTLIRLYQVVFSTRQGEVCNFTPSCSNYAHQAIEKYGLLGVIIAADRLERCNYSAWQYKDKYYKVKWIEKRGNKLYDPVDNRKF
ncbi:MAG: membrane protein insertion efficiency factor YidD [Candidatus Stahlbacteria bacterium]|nr:membrane protein insertion efficiency factor YidD [Candidatus Stahlbacteria bacterium]